MLFVAIGMICSSLLMTSCEMVTPQDLFASEAECEAWIDAERAENVALGYQARFGCTDVDMPKPEPRKGRES
jgi:hypothetical protein